MEKQSDRDRPEPAPTVHRATFDPTGRLTTIPTRALFDSRVKDHHLALLCVLGYQDSQHRDGWFEASQAEIARFRGKGRTAITNTFKDLVAWGYVDALQRRDPDTNVKLANIYRLRFDADFDSAHQRSAEPAPDPLRDDVTVTPAVAAQEDEGYVIPSDIPIPGMSFPVTYQVGYVTPSDIGSSYPFGYVTPNDIPKSGTSPQVTHNGRYVIPSDDSLKTLKESEDLKKRAGVDESENGDLPLFAGSETTGSREPRDTAAQLVRIFEDLHAQHFGMARRPDHERLMAEAPEFIADGLPMDLARQVIEVVFGRLTIRGSTHASTFQVVRQTWRFIVNRWRDAGKPTDPDAWEDLFNENRHAWAEFQSIYPRPEGLKADVTRAAFDQAARAAGGAHVVVDAARRYAGRVRGKEERFIKSAAKWLGDGFWRDDVPAEPSTTISTDEAAAPQADLQVGQVDGLRAEVWTQVVADLVARHGHDRGEVATWLRSATVRAPAQDVIAVEVDSKFLRDQVETRFGDHLRAAFGARVGDGVTVSVVTRV